MAKQTFWSPAYPRIQLWRTIVGILVIHALFFAATFLVFIVGARLLGTDPGLMLGASTPAEATVFFLTFLGYHIGLWLTVRMLHKRGFRSLFGPALRVNWHHFKRGLMVAIGISIAAILLQLVQSLLLPPGPETSAQQSMRFVDWALLVVPALMLVLMQVFAEELVFRGYVLQQLRARFRSIWIWAILPSLAFGVLHYDPVTYGINGVFYVTHTAVIGILLAVVTLRTGNIGAAAGLHFGNNAMLIFSGTKGTLDGFSLFLTEMDLTSAQMTWSILTQTFAVLAAFALWWKLTQHNQPIANAAQAD
ncbi:type II CAAX endopeptidase family protein [Aliiroseovarius sp. F47248L]|uniref:CPBP family intramembrane glutamic endopeptidase n=1 Tax=Aliiroseovarius sp. F47248L TaxID=2926420 RepID=UPI001FF15055|nr:type II CAAX endopeptidase family protein [Aliiroseovarius sp. F47248L]MCK0139844.1 CPBP family intramembrane metalloprotease [Aliiroseovarius sp. F47248L]